ncbi:MAG TPA: mechanosensitive ion channel domain-containing protein [Gemmatimonadales bacterium]|nr:mechanosensitive ion channel domain-containing protein [Gemmatimonadales bacterium]
MLPLRLPSLSLALLLHGGEVAAAARQDTAGTDSVVAQDPEPVTVQRADQDETIRNTLQAVFDRVPSLRRVNVTVDAGVVRLEGTVLSSETRSQAGAMAAELDGVIFVNNQIRESTSMEEQLEPTWARMRELGYGFVAKLPLVALAIVIIGIASVLGSLLSRWGGPSFLRTRNPFLQNLIRRLLQAAVVLAGILLALDLLDAGRLVGAMIGTAGLAGLAIGFAFKDIMENYLAGVILAVRQPFAQTDHIRVGEFEGKLVRLTPRETILMTLDGNHVRLPNAMIFRSPLVNFSRNPLRRFQFDAGLGPANDLARVREVAVGALKEMQGVLRVPAPEALIVDLSDSAVTVRFLAWTDQRQAEFLRVRSEAIRLVKSRLEDAGMTLPSPEYLIRMQSDSAAPAGASPAPPTTPPKVTTADVAVDRTVDEQIESDRRGSDEPDLLDPPTSGKRP